MGHGRAFHEAAERADVIHFELEGVGDLKAAVEAGKKGFIKDNFTNAELHYIVSNPELLKKTEFYYKGVRLESRPTF